MRRQYKPKPGAQEVLPLLKTPDGPPSAGVQDTQHQRPVGHRHDGALVTIHKLAGGELLFYRAPEKWLLDSRLIHSDELPRNEPGHIRIRLGDDFIVHAVRLPDGEIGLTISASQARIRDLDFLAFMAETMDPAALSGPHVINEGRS